MTTAAAAAVAVVKVEYASIGAEYKYMSTVPGSKYLTYFPQYPVVR
jgi:hypothetical protein